MIIKRKNAALNDVQVEVNYAIKLDDQWTVRPGMLTHFSSNGTRYGPYVKLSWDATKDLNFGIPIVTTGKLTDNKTYPVICLVITFIVGMDMSLTILIVISPSHGKRRYTANRTIIAMQTIRNGRRKMHLFYNTI
ncbi:N-acetylneuraminic acid outer membrane channel protein NanC [Escherichia coli]|uniref:N-acetylneuraminic acid outer membrane channel protein NanC n=1 Tax=Escherichia coli TaxID=562 RepID=A0A377KE14_ECOLX|nr:N-acetylneuraminic acid outer membrane channel protein NanC [Escherichia coli]